MDGERCPSTGVIQEYLQKESSEMIVPGLLPSREVNFVQENIKWIRETVVTGMQLQCVTAYLATNYFIRALCSDIVLGSEKEYRVLAMTCSFMAIKLDEVDEQEGFILPSHLTKVEDEQKAIIAMEAVVVDKLDWNLIVVTPLNYIQFIMTKLCIFHSLEKSIVDASSLRICQSLDDLSFLEMKPSVIAAAVMTREAVKAGANVSERGLYSIFEMISEESVKKCWVAIDMIEQEKVAMPSTSTKQGTRWSD